MMNMALTVLVCAIGLFIIAATFIGVAAVMVCGRIERLHREHHGDLPDDES